MTEKDLLDSLRFVDDDLIEEAGLEQLKEEKQKKNKWKSDFFEDSTYSSRGHLYFHRRNSYGKKDHGKKRSNRWRADDGCVYRKRI